MAHRKNETGHVEVFAERRVLALRLGVVIGAFLNFLLANLYVYRRHWETPAIGSSRK